MSGSRTAKATARSGGREAAGRCCPARRSCTLVHDVWRTDQGGAEERREICPWAAARTCSTLINLALHCTSLRMTCISRHEREPLALPAPRRGCGAAALQHVQANLAGRKWHSFACVSFMPSIAVVQMNKKYGQCAVLNGVATIKYQVLLLLGVICLSVGLRPPASCHRQQLLPAQASPRAERQQRQPGQAARHCEQENVRRCASTNAWLAAAMHTCSTAAGLFDAPPLRSPQPPAKQPVMPSPAWLVRSASVPATELEQASVTPAAVGSHSR